MCVAQLNYYSRFNHQTEHCKHSRHRALPILTAAIVNTPFPPQFKLRPVVEDVLDLTHVVMSSYVDLQNYVPADTYVAGDAGRVIQILNNLVANATKFTREGHIRCGPPLQLTTYVLPSIVDSVSRPTYFRHRIRLPVSYPCLRAPACCAPPHAC